MVCRAAGRTADGIDFKARLGNRCKVLPVYALLRASILDFRPRLANRCRVFPVLALFRASILDFRPRLANRCSVIAAAVRNGPPATAVVAAIFRVRLYSSLPQRRTARLLRPSPHRPSASDSILRCGIEKNSPPAVCRSERRRGQDATKAA